MSTDVSVLYIIFYILRLPGAEIVSCGYCLHLLLLCTAISCALQQPVVVSDL